MRISNIIVCFVICFFSFWLLVSAETIPFQESWEYASNSVIHSGTSTLYHASNSNGYVIAINAGHGTAGGEQVKTLCHPDGTPKVTGGSTAEGEIYATAVSSGTEMLDGTAEATVTLEMAKILKAKLLQAGFDVLMIRDGADVQLDNIARTVMANNNADIHLALHWDSTTTDKGVFFMSVPDIGNYRNMEPVKSHYMDHNNLGKTIIEAMKADGIKIYGNGEMALDLTQTSYSTIPSIDIELGDRASNYDQSTLYTLAEGILHGVSNYFNVSYAKSESGNARTEVINFGELNVSSQTEEIIKEAMKSWPETLEKGRVDVIKNAISLLDKGIRYSHNGKITYSINQLQTSGMDCSDYVSWAFHNAGYSMIGDWCTGDFVGSDLFTEISSTSLIPGDVALNSRDSKCNGGSNHIGIYIGTKNGQPIYLHSSSSNNNFGPQIRNGNGNFTLYKRFNNFDNKMVKTESGNSSLIPKEGRVDDPFPNNGWISFNEASKITCDTLFMTNGELNELGKFFNTLFLIIRILTPSLVIILSSMDYFKTMSNDKSEVSQTNKRTLKRLITGIIILILPSLLEFIFTLYGLYDISTCIRID